MRQKVYAYQDETNNISRVARMYRNSTVTFTHDLCHCMSDDKNKLHLLIRNWIENGCK